MDSEQAFLLQHSAHDPKQLIERWRAVVDQAGLTMKPVTEQFGQEIFGIRSESPPNSEVGLYLSAGVHGDEPGGSEGLIAWAESNVDFLRATPCVILPCFNPSGILMNTRCDAAGVDLNRKFDDPSHPLIGAWRSFLGDARFRLALCLHEDYDAHGIYVYELGVPGLEAGEACLASCETIIPREPDLDIEGRPAANAIVRRSEDFDRLAAEMDEGLPEAIYLRMHHAAISLTFETPSEYSLFTRVRAHVRCIDAALATAGIRGQ